MAYKDPLDERLREARRKHYHNNKEQYLERNKAKKLEMKKFVADLKNVPCMDCGIKYNPWVMEFDHRDPNEKVENIGRAISRGSWTKLKEEVAKCDVVCSNCHRERSAKMFGWESLILD
jgi:hypothetical protein